MTVKKYKKKLTKKLPLSLKEREHKAKVKNATLTMYKYKPMTALTLEQKSEVIRLMANYMRPKDIRQHVQDEFGLELKQAAIAAFAKTHKEEVRLKRAEIMAELDDIPLVHKKVRILKLSTYIRSLEKIKDKDNLSAAAAMLKNVRDEV